MTRKILFMRMGRTWKVSVTQLMTWLQKKLCLRICFTSKKFDWWVLIKRVSGQDLQNCRESGQENMFKAHLDQNETTQSAPLSPISSPNHNSGTPHNLWSGSKRPDPSITEESSHIWIKMKQLNLHHWVPFHHQIKILEHLIVCGVGARDLTQRNMVVTQMFMHFLELGSPWESHP